MWVFRTEQRTAPECNSVGCALGHATRLETGDLPRYADGNISFVGWSEIFTGLREISPEWGWCFWGTWGEHDDTPLGAAKRIEYLLEGKPLPDLLSLTGPTAEMVEMYS
jgi:hypothetical protein